MIEPNIRIELQNSFRRNLAASYGQAGASHPLPFDRSSDQVHQDSTSDRSPSCSNGAGTGPENRSGIAPTIIAKVTIKSTDRHSHIPSGHGGNIDAHFRHRKHYPPIQSNQPHTDTEHFHLPHSIMASDDFSPRTMAGIADTDEKNAKRLLVQARLKRRSAIPPANGRIFLVRFSVSQCMRAAGRIRMRPSAALLLTYTKSKLQISIRQERLPSANRSITCMIFPTSIRYMVYLRII